MSPDRAVMLVVDDNAAMRRLLRKLMHSMGVTRIDEAADGGAAFELFEKTPYDLVLTDWNMPQLTGLQLIRRIRESPVRSDTPVVLFTGQVTARSMIDALEAGATDFVGKPFNVGNVCQKVLRILERLEPV